jgi:cytokinesis protein
MTVTPGMPNLSMLLSARKDLPISANTKMKQLQWDKLPQQLAEKTVFNEDDTSREHAWVKMFQKDGIWQEMEDDFKAKQLVMNLMARQKRAELKSVLDPQTKKSVGVYSSIVVFSPIIRLIPAHRNPHATG